MIKDPISIGSNLIRSIGLCVVGLVEDKKSDSLIKLKLIDEKRIKLHRFSESPVIRPFTSYMAIQFRDLMNWFLGFGCLYHPLM